MYRSVVGATIWCPYRHSSKTIEDFLFESEKTSVSVEQMNSSLRVKVYLLLKVNPCNQQQPSFGFLQWEMYHSTEGETIQCPYRDASKIVEDVLFEVQKSGVPVDKFSSSLHFKVYLTLKVTPSHQ